MELAKRSVIHSVLVSVRSYMASDKYGWFHASKALVAVG